MDTSTIGRLLHYHYRMFDQVWEYALPLTADQFVAESDYSLRSVRNHLVHCMNVDARWLARLMREALPARLNPLDYHDQNAVRLKWEIIRERVLQYARDVPDVALNEPIWVDLPSRFPEPRPFRRWEILLHLANHGTDHRAQILARLHELGAKTFEQDLILHWWTNGESA